MMTNYYREMLIKFNHARQNREKCEESEKENIRLKRLTLYAFIISVLIVLMIEAVINFTIIKEETISNFFINFPIIEYAFVFLGIVSFVWFIFYVLKSIEIELRSQKAMYVEGVLAQRLHKVLLLNNQGDIKKYR